MARIRRRVVSWLIAAMAGAFIVGATQAQAQGVAACSALTPVPTKIEVSVEPAVEPAIRAASREELQDLADQSGRSQKDEAVTRGVASTEFQASVQYELLEQTLADTRRCTALSTVTAHFSLPTATIHIERRYRPGSCEYDAVLKHEREHVRITSDVLQRWEGRIRQELESALARWRDRWLPTAVDQEIQPAIDRVGADLVQKIQTDAGPQQAAIDTPAAYEKVRQQCSGW